MSPLAVYGLCVLSGICIYAGFNHWQTTLGRPDRRAHQIFALMCFSAAAMALFTISLRWASSPQQVVDRVRGIMALACVVCALTPWLVAAYTRAESRRIPAVLSAMYAAFFVLNLVLPYGVFLTAPPAAEFAQWSPVERMRALLQDVGRWRLIWWLLHLLTFAYVLIRCIHQYRHGERYRAVALGASCTLLVGSFINNALIAVGLNPLPYLGHLGFLGLVVLMSFSLGRELRQSDQRLRAMLDSVPALAYVKDRSGKLLFANRHLKKLHGLNGASPHAAEQLEAAALGREWQAHDAQILAKAEAQTFEETWQRDGEVRSYLSLKFPLTDRHGRAYAVGSVSSDITELNRVRHALALREAQLRLLIDSTEQGILALDLDGRCTLANRTCRIMMGYDDSRPLLGKRIARLLLHLGPSATQSQEVHDAVRRALEHGERSHAAHLKCYRSDGSWFDAEYWCQPLLNDGKIEGAVISILDITERKRVADAIGALAQASAGLDSDAFFRHCVRSLAQLYGVRYGVIGLLESSRTRVRTVAIWAGDRFVDNREFELAHSPCENVANLSRRLISEGVARMFPDDVLLSRANIESYFVTPIVASSGEIVGIVVLLGEQSLQVGPASERIIDIFANRISVELERKAALHEVSELNGSLERRVVERTRELSQMNADLEAFSYSVSHDLRAPLTAMHGFSSLLLKHYAANLDVPGQRYLQRIVEGSRRMGELIEGLLALAHIARQPLQQQRIDLAQLARESLRQLREAHPQRNVRCEIAPSLPTAGDQRLLQVLVYNLLENAWKYTGTRAEPCIELGTVRHGQENVFFVRDNGIGFDPAQAERLFQPFRRLHDDKQFHGTGIGLATVARIVGRHGGRIWAEGLPQQGATFYFTLPEAATVSHEESARDTQDLDATLP